MPKRQKLSPAQRNLNRRYSRALSRIRKTITDYESQGLLFDDLSFIPTQPKRVTEASIRRLSNLTKRKISTHATSYVDTDTGEILSATQGRILIGQRKRTTARIKREIRKASKKQREKLLKKRPDAEFVGKTTKGEDIIQISNHQFVEPLDFADEILPISDGERAIEYVLEVAENYYYGRTTGQESVQYMMLKEWIDNSIEKHGRKVTGTAIKKVIESGDVPDPADAYRVENMHIYLMNLGKALEATNAEMSELIDDMTYEEEEIM